MRSEGRHRKRSGALTQILSLALVLAWPSLAAASGVPRASNLEALARTPQAHHAPIVLLFWSPGCRYCAVVERDFLQPASTDPRFRRVVFRRIDIDSAKSLVDFTGHATTEARFAKRLGVALVPDIRFYNAKGQKVAPEMRGLSTPSFYGSYLDAALRLAQNGCQRS